MTFRRATRAQSIQLGVLLVFAMMIVSFSLYQATVVPAQNKQVEFRHAQQIHQDMLELRHAIFQLGHTGGMTATTLQLGTQYPPRLIAVNPPPPHGTLETTAARPIRLTVESTGGGGGGADQTAAVDLPAVCGYDSGPVTTRTIRYTPAYAEYQTALSHVYESTVSYRARDGTPLVFDSNQTLVENTTVSLIPVTGAYTRATAQAVTLTVKGGPVGQDTVALSQNHVLNLSIPTRLSPTVWRQLLSDESYVQSVTAGGPNRVQIILEGGRDYTVVCYAVGINAAPPSGVAPLEPRSA